MTTPRVSVLMTIYQAEPYLGAAIDSLLAQTFEDWELVAVENGSTDGSKAILEDYPDPRIRIIPLDSNVGRTPALNLALREARGEYCAVLDADDIALAGRFAKQVAFLDTSPDISLVGGQAIVFGIDIEDHPTVFYPTDHEAIVREFSDWTALGHSMVMYRTQIARSVGGYPEQYRYAQDCAFYLAIIGSGRRVANLPDTVTRIRVHPAQASIHPSWALDRARDAISLYRTAARLPEMTARELKRNRSKLLECRLQLARAEWRNGLPIAALVSTLHAVSLGPLRVLRTAINRVFLADRHD